MVPRDSGESKIDFSEPTLGRFTRRVGGRMEEETSDGGEGTSNQ